MSPFTQVDQAANPTQQASTKALTLLHIIPGMAGGFYKSLGGHIATITLSQSVDVIFYAALGGVVSFGVQHVIRHITSLINAERTFK